MYTNTILKYLVVALIGEVLLDQENIPRVFSYEKD